MKSREQKFSEGQERVSYWRSLTPAQQLTDLDRRLGVGRGAVRQRKMIVTRIADAGTGVNPGMLVTPSKKEKK